MNWMNSSAQARRLFSLLTSGLIHVLLLFLLFVMHGRSSDATAVGEGHRLQVVLLDSSFDSVSVPAGAATLMLQPSQPSKPSKLSQRSSLEKSLTVPGLTGYLPVSQLTERPLVVNDIDSDLSDRFAGINSQSLVLVLLINEYGDVDQVLPDGDEWNDVLPAVLKDDLRQRFLTARFFPGRLHGRPVRCALRIAVMLY